MSHSQDTRLIGSKIKVVYQDDRKANFKVAKCIDVDFIGVWLLPENPRTEADVIPHNRIIRMEVISWE